MNHNCTAMLAIDPRVRNDSVYQKTLGINDFYFDNGRGGPPLGNVQLLGKITAPILKANLPRAPGFALSWLARHSVDWYLMSEDLPDPESRVRVDGSSIVLDWRRSNMTAHERLVARMRELFRAAGYSIVLARPFDRRTPSHQCGTVRFGTDPATSALDPFCRAHDHPNLYVVDAGFLPTSAAVNPALTIAAQALRVADHLAGTRAPMPAEVAHA
jgi:choline dehydrogenase-like flavoprotein